MAEASNLKKAGTGKSGLGILLIAVGVVALIAVVVWALTNPDILEATINVIIIIVVAIVVIALIIAGVMLLMAIPFAFQMSNLKSESQISNIKSPF